MIKTVITACYYWMATYSQSAIINHGNDDTEIQKPLFPRSKDDHFDYRDSIAKMVRFPSKSHTGKIWPEWN